MMEPGPNIQITRRVLYESYISRKQDLHVISLAKCKSIELMSTSANILLTIAM
jgi:hypothetical protein